LDALHHEEFAPEALVALSQRLILPVIEADHFFVLDQNIFIPCRDQPLWLMRQECLEFPRQVAFSEPSDKIMEVSM